MILGLGIDAVEVDRFTHWNRYTQKQLLRIFSVHEITYALSEQTKYAERLAVRFAAKEAFYKALCAWMAESTFSLLAVCASVSVISKKGAPILRVNWSQLAQKYQLSFKTNPCILLSLTHTNTTAMAVVIIY